MSLQVGRYPYGLRVEDGDTYPKHTSLATIETLPTFYC